MKYLLYHSKGYIKKFPLKKKSMTIGREETNDLMIDDEFISRVHIKVEIEGKGIKIQDLHSSNGIFVKTEKVKEAILKPGESFSIGGAEIFLKEGTLEEFKIAAQLAPVFNGISKDNKRKFRPIKTKAMVDIYNEMLKQILCSGLKRRNFSDFLSNLSGHLSGLKYFGNLFLVSRLDEEINVLFSVKRDSEKAVDLFELISKNRQIFKKTTTQKIPGIGYHFHSFPFKIDTQNVVLIYIYAKDERGEEKKIIPFLISLAEEVHLLSRILKRVKGNEKSSFLEQGDPDFPDSSEDIQIIASSNVIKELIVQSKKMARSDIFVLIQGESGTGKELFARLIHWHSRRHKKPFIALNCASIPENLLESEFFGYEKGAFTGAYERKKGKLEMASGGTLVMDEIGDMPLNLQSKLLRALQENEFYRLGGTDPIKVDLRIISITNRDIIELIQSGNFRKDFYFRLVHRAIKIPPLRERREDISVLINFFTNKFCHQSGKTIKGYSLRAFQMLQNYDWPGNVRQLENEVRSIVSLIEDCEMVTHELISEDIKSTAYQEQDKDVAILSAARDRDPEKEKENLLKLLEKYGWNQSRTARQLNMTYWGLHKKIKRLGITIPEKQNGH